MKKRNEKGEFIKTLKDKRCKQCNKVFTPNGNQSKFCSPQCYWESKRGQESKKKNGKNIKCKTCGKEFYVSGSRIGIKKYCSNDCVINDNHGFKKKEKQCIICGKQFIISRGIEISKKTCSTECRYQNNRNVAIKRNQEKPKKERVDWKSFKDGRSVDRGLHGRVCAKYKEDFLKKHEYLFCEVCEVNSNGTPRFETHHIVFASEAPNHKELHNKKNLILVCTGCHHKFHGKKRETRKHLVIERKLELLFGKNLCDK